jgi:hypothetical protein
VSRKDGKNVAPAFQFYPQDWLADTRMLPPASRGLWIDLLCAMWTQAERGVIRGSVEELARATSCTMDEFECNFRPLEVRAIGDVSRDCHGVVTIKSRRMIRDVIEREKANRRQHKCRERKAVTPLSRDCHGSSPSPSPSPCTSYTPPNPQGGVAGELHFRLLETGKFPNLTLATVAEVVRSFPKARAKVVLEAVPRLAMDVPSLRIQAPDRWLRARMSEIEMDSGVHGDADLQKKKNAALLLPMIPPHPRRKVAVMG